MIVAKLNLGAILRALGKAAYASDHATLFFFCRSARFARNAKFVKLPRDSAQPTKHKASPALMEHVMAVARVSR